MVQTNLAILPFYRNCFAVLITQVEVRYILCNAPNANAFSNLLSGCVMSFFMAHVGVAYYTKDIYQSSKRGWVIRAA